MKSMSLKENKEKLLGGFTCTLQWIRDFLNSYLFYAFEFFLACFFIYFRKEVYGVLLFVALLSLILLICNDIVPTTMPFLLVCTFATNCYNSFDTFIVYAKYAPIVFACALFHFVVYRKSYSIGYSFKGLFAVSIALCLGGFGGFTLMQYAKGSFYVLGLGAGMMIAYALMKSEFAPKRSYDLKVRFSVMMLMMAVLCVVIMIIGTYYRKKYGLMYLGVYYWHKFSSNNLATLLMFAMPFPLYLSKKNPLWAIFTPLILVAIMYSESRGGMLFGVVEFLFCVAYWIYIGNRKIRSCVVIGMAIIGGVMLFQYWDGIWSKISAVLQIEALKEEMRYTMLLESIENFKKNPLWGTGLLDDSIAYGTVNKKGTMTWYHMMIPQIIGSMGLIGLVAYCFQMFGRVKLIFTKKDAWSLCLGLSYLGVFLMSQVNPGEFCPIPFQLLAVLLFIFQEQRFVNRALWEKSF